MSRRRVPHPFTAVDSQPRPIDLVGVLRRLAAEPFYGAYNVISLDEEYGWSLVCGKDYASLWILSRTPQLPDPVVKQLVEKAEGLGFKTDALVFVKQQ